MSVNALLRVLAIFAFILVTVGIAPAPMTPLGLALWSASPLMP